MPTTNPIASINSANLIPERNATKLAGNAISKTTLGKVVATNLSPKKGTAKRNAFSIAIDERGVVGDAHADHGHRQVSLLSQESMTAFTQRTGTAITPGDFGENITYSDIDFKNIGILDRLTINDTILEITQIGKECHGSKCAIFKKVGQCVMPCEGFFTHVVRPGKITVGDVIVHMPYTLKILIITMSDRAAAGVYTDKSGEMARSMLTQFFDAKSSMARARVLWHWEIEQMILPDDAEQLRTHLNRALENKIDIIFTLGGTGIGARDITPEVVGAVCDKFLPSIMEHIRLKYGTEHPAALLSRSIAGIARQHTQIYTLPGSVRAVSEYLTEILQTLEHAIFMLHGIDRH